MKDGVKMMRPVLNREEYLKLRNGGFQCENVARIRSGDEKLKASLVQMNYSCLPNDDGSLKGATRMSTTVGMDIDHLTAEDMPVVRERILSKKDELGLLMMEKSARGWGYHLVFQRRADLDQVGNLKWASELLNVAYDAQAKDITRVFFTTTEEDLLYLDDEIFSRKEEGGTRKMDDVRRKMEEGRSQTSDLSLQPSGKQFPTHYHGISFATILKKYWEVNNGGYEPTEGDRDTLTFQLASDLRHICGKSFEWLDQVIPCYDGFPLEEKRQKIKNALASKYEGMPQRLRDTLAALDVRCKMEDGRGKMDDGNPQTSTPPEMPEKMPKLIALLTSKTPQMYKAAVAHAVFPALGTHLKEVRFLYTDNVEHEATLMNVLMAGTGAGKGCIDKPIKHIMADIRRRDAENEKREREWKKDCQKKGANKDKLVRPEGLVIQIIDPDMTKPALVTRMDESEGHFVYVKLNELDLFDQLKGTTGKQHFQLMCLAFDPDSEYGQTRIGTQSVTARPRCRFNWNACTTVQKGQKYFRNVLTDGPISRINFCTIPESEIGIEQPIYGQYDAAFDEALKPYIDNLCAARGFVDCPQATKLAKKLQQECAEFARLSQDEVYWNLSFRACVIAWLKACVLYVANGCKWEKSIEDFVRWSLNYDLWCKMQFFGDAIRKANCVDETSGRRGPHNLLLDLPDVFSLEDARRVRRQQGLPDKGLRPMISNWKSRGYINQISEISFQKLRFKSDK
jgi:hypothetical protein